MTRPPGIPQLQHHHPLIGRQGVVNMDPQLTGRSGHLAAVNRSEPVLFDDVGEHLTSWVRSASTGTRQRHRRCHPVRRRPNNHAGALLQTLADAIRLSRTNTSAGRRCVQPSGALLTSGRGSARGACQCRIASQDAKRVGSLNPLLESLTGALRRLRLGLGGGRKRGGSQDRPMTPASRAAATAAVREFTPSLG